MELLLRKTPMTTLVKIVWSFAKLDIGHDGLFKAVADVSKHRYREMNDEMVPYFIWSYSKMSLDHLLPRFLAVIAQESKEITVQLLNTESMNFFRESNRINWTASVLLA